MTKNSVFSNFQNVSPFLTSLSLEQHKVRHNDQNLKIFLLEIETNDTFSLLPNFKVKKISKVSAESIFGREC